MNERKDKNKNKNQLVYYSIICKSFEAAAFKIIQHPFTDFPFDILYSSFSLEYIIYLSPRGSSR